MKKLIISLTFVITGLLASAQTTYSNGSVNTATGTPGQGSPSYNGTNPTGQPNQIPTYSVDPVKPLNPPATPVNPKPNGDSPIQPNTTSPIQPNTTSPIPPAVPATPNKEK